MKNIKKYILYNLFFIKPDVSCVMWGVQQYQELQDEKILFKPNAAWLVSTMLFTITSLSILFKTCMNNIQGMEYTYETINTSGEIEETVQIGVNETSGIFILFDLLTILFFLIYISIRKILDIIDKEIIVKKRILYIVDITIIAYMFTMGFLLLFSTRNSDSLSVEEQNIRPDYTIQYINNGTNYLSGILGGNPVTEDYIDLLNQYRNICLFLHTNKVNNYCRSNISSSFVYYTLDISIMYLLKASFMFIIFLIDFCKYLQSRFFSHY